MSEKIKIVFLTDCLADTGAGAEKQIVELARRLSPQQYEIFVASLESTGSSSEKITQILKKPVYNFKVVRIYGISGLVQGLKFFRFLKENKIDILQTYHFSSDIWGTFWGKMAGVRAVISNRRDMGFWRQSQHIKTYRLFNRWVNQVVVVAEPVKTMVVKEEHFPESRVRLIHNGVEMPKNATIDRAAVRSNLGLKDNELMILHVGNLKPVKGHRYLLQAFHELIKDHPHLKLLLVGEDGMDGELQRLAESLGLKEKVFFLGKRQDVRNLLVASDICVLPSISEGMSNAVLEYMSAGKPVVATRVGGNPELIKDGHNGLLVPKEDAGALKNALNVLIQDPPTRLSMGQNGFKTAENQFSFERMVSAYQNLYESLLK